MIRKLLFSILAVALGAIALVVVQPANALTDWGFTIQEGDAPGGWQGNPVCADGENARDTVTDHIVVDPTVNGFLRAELFRNTPSAQPVFSRTSVKIAPDKSEGLEDDWYTRVPYGKLASARLLSIVDQAWSFDFTDASSAGLREVGTLPAVGRETEFVFHTNYSLTKQSNNVASCDVSVTVWAAGDPDIPAGATYMQNVAHPAPHHSVNDNYAQKFRVFEYPAGPDFPSTCHVDDPVSAIERDEKGEFRLEPVVGNKGPNPVTGDIWAFNTYGGERQFNWRVRSPNLPPGGSDLTQSGQRWSVFLPGDQIVQDYQPVGWEFGAHFHRNPDLHDMNGLVCMSKVNVS